ncbi:MAG: glycosyltransferase family 2 protein [Oligoflexales bacterium]|nr:glycosyltransferase family 2 protein [Oligoflexales bacterium]
MNRSTHKNKLTCSILIPVYNGEAFIKKALLSAFSQGDDVEEVIVVDNCSTDNTWDLLQQFKSEKLKLYRNAANLGLFANFNCCLEKAKGDVLVFLCADDVLSKDAVAKALLIMGQDNLISVLNMSGRAIRENGAFIKTIANFISPGIYQGSVAALRIFQFLTESGYNALNYPSGVFLNRRIISENQIRFDSTFKKCGDIEFYLKLLNYGNLAVSRDVSCDVTFHKNQVGQQGRQSTIELEEFLTILRRFNDENQLTTSDDLQFKVRSLALWRALKFMITGDFLGFKSHIYFAFDTKKPLLVLLNLTTFILKKLSYFFQRPTLNIPKKNFY